MNRETAKALEKSLREDGVITGETVGGVRTDAFVPTFITHPSRTDDPPTWIKESRTAEPAFQKDPTPTRVAVKEALDPDSGRQFHPNQEELLHEIVGSLQGIRGVLEEVVAELKHIKGATDDTNGILVDQLRELGSKIDFLPAG